MPVGFDEVPGSSYRTIAKIADDAFDEKEMVQFVRDAFLSQKAFGAFLGVGESTVAGWMKSGSFPDYAKRDATRPKGVKDGDRSSIVETKSSRAPAAAKYRHPDNLSLTSSGRGRKPQWFVEALASGKMAEDMAIV